MNQSGIGPWPVDGAGPTLSDVQSPIRLRTRKGRDTTETTRHLFVGPGTPVGFEGPTSVTQV